jgi:outer membrane murein-binding lipoprotein Lpp
MDARAWIIGFTWLAVMVTAYSYLSIGKISWQTDIAVALLFLVGCTVTIIVGFGLEYFQTQMEKEKPSTKNLAQMSAEITEMKSMIQKLTEKVDAMQKELQE